MLFDGDRSDLGVLVREKQQREVGQKSWFFEMEIVHSAVFEFAVGQVEEPDVSFEIRGVRDIWTGLLV